MALYPRTVADLLGSTLGERNEDFGSEIDGLTHGKNFAELTAEILRRCLP
jgi:hypothetical protein